MSNIQRIVTGLNVLFRLVPNGYVQGEHDELFCEGPHPKDMAVEDVSKLIEAGWRWDESLESWATFT
jgi:hypothetical protein